MRRHATACLLLAWSFAFAVPVLADELDLSRHYLLLATKKTSTMQEELNQATAAGFRVVWGSPTSGAEVMLVLEKVADQQAYDYLLLATDRTSTMTKEMNDGAAQGYRVIPSTLLGKKGFMGNVEILVVMERARGGDAAPAPPVEYLLLATSRTGTLQKEMSEQRAQGFRIVSLASRDEHLAIMEKPQE